MRNGKSTVDRGGDRANVVDVRNLALVIAVIPLEELLDDIVLDSNALGILIENGFNILRRPKRVLIEFERNYASAWTAKRHHQKVSNKP
jgi:hypothetical protein